MRDPYHQEWYEGRIFKKRLRLFPAESFRFHGGCLFGKVVDDGFSLGLIQELYRLRVIG